MGQVATIHRIAKTGPPAPPAIWDDARKESMWRLPTLTVGA